VLALVPGLPTIELSPEFVLLLVLPPVIYFSAFNMSWREFKFNLRPITLLAVGCVLFTTIAVAAAVHWLLGFTWPVGFVLGAIVSPPDPLAPLSIARRLELPRRILVILEGEGLANDAAALILYRFAVAAVVSGAFSPTKAAGIFAAIVIGEILWGIGVGLVCLASAALGARSACRNYAIGFNAGFVLLGTCVFRRLGRNCDSDRWSLFQLEWFSVDQRRDETARNIFLGFFDLSHRRHGVSYYRASGTRASCADRQ
jgi:hypothetical protein